MKLSEYIKLIGDEKAAADFSVKPRTTGSWRRGERTPRKEQAAVIVKATNGIVSFQDIYEDHQKSEAA